jgi:HD-GYP domain-containing protein (c-di-GMP phosphodiesterase class II)
MSCSDISDLIEDISLDVEERERADEGLALEKTGFWNIGKVEGKNTMQEARAYQKKLLTIAHHVQSSVQSNTAIDISSVIKHVRRIIDNDLIEPLYYYLVFEGSKKITIAEHAIEVTVFSPLVGLGMGYNKKRLLPLALLAFLHDVGMYKIPQDILNKKGTLNEQELKAVKRHPEISAGILSELGDRFAWLANLSLQIHERADGTGYPRGLKEGRIHEFAFIVGLVDMYSAMIKDRPYRNRLEKNKAMKTVISSSRGKFPARVVKAFLNQISFFPVGSHVRLNDRSAGRVINTNPGFPLKSIVEILYDHAGNKLKKPKIVDLSQQPLLHITESIDEKDFI